LGYLFSRGLPGRKTTDIVKAKKEKEKYEEKLPLTLQVTIKDAHRLFIN